MILKTAFPNCHITDPQTNNHVRIMLRVIPKLHRIHTRIASWPHANTLKNATVSYGDVVSPALKNAHVERASSLIFHRGRNTRFTTSAAPNTLAESGLAGDPKHMSP